MHKALADRILHEAARFYVGKRIRIVTGAVPRRDGPVLYAANHPTTLDPVLLQHALKLSYSALLTEAAFSLPLVGPVLLAAGNEPVGQKGSGGQGLIEAIARRAKEGRSLAIFPEGRLSPGPGLFPLRSGAARLAATARLPVVPVGIAVSESGVKEISMKVGDRLETGRYLLRGWYVVRMGKPLAFDNRPEDRSAVDACTARLDLALRRLCGEARSLLAILEGREDPRSESWSELGKESG